MSDLKQVTLYTDGACSGNPGAGGWGAILIFGEHRRELSGGEAQTTNNRMELTAVIEGLERLKFPRRVDVYSDSAYTVNGFLQGWVYAWEKRGWIKPDKKPVLNDDLWKKLLTLTREHEVTFHKVKGHANTPPTTRCDDLAGGAIDERGMTGKAKTPRLERGVLHFLECKYVIMSDIILC